MYHVELRQFPHNFCRFNLSGQELHETILDAWVRGDWVELGERKWGPHQAKLTVLEGPQLAISELSMGRGWRNAIRQGRDVTTELLSAALGPADPSRSERPSTAGHIAELGDTASLSLAADSLGLEVLARLDRPMAFSVVWQLARECYPEQIASDCLRVAEQAVRSLLQSRLAIVLVRGAEGTFEPCQSSEQVERILYALDSWSSGEDKHRAVIDKA